MDAMNRRTQGRRISLNVRRVSGIDNAILGSYDAPPPFLCSLKYFCASEELEGHLAKQSIDGISDHFGKPGLIVIGVDEPDEESLMNLPKRSSFSMDEEGKGGKCEMYQQP
jgi:hypothetical protein